ncbi:hypothetical protein [Pseudomonas peli]|jgi:hypothetical protein|uniref:hypothetical protein n=1 Tax=Pseudomonas peli TaxID=592361 RepID=UPI003D312E9C
MGRFVVLGVIGLLLVGCADHVREEACKVFSPAQIETPSNQDDQRIDSQSGSGADGGMPDQRC